MVTRRKTTRRRTTTTKAAPRRRRTNTGVNKIPKAAAIVGMAYAGRRSIEYGIQLFMNAAKGERTFISAADNLINRSILPHAKEYAIAGIGAYAAGWAAKELLPNTGVFGKLKKAAGGIAKKVA